MICDFGDGLLVFEGLCFGDFVCLYVCLVLIC